MEKIFWEKLFFHHVEVHSVIILVPCCKALCAAAAAILLAGEGAGGVEQVGVAAGGVVLLNHYEAAVLKSYCEGGAVLVAGGFLVTNSSCAVAGDVEVDLYGNVGTLAAAKVGGGFPFALRKRCVGGVVGYLE